MIIIIIGIFISIVFYRDFDKVTEETHTDYWNEMWNTVLKYSDIRICFKKLSSRGKGLNLSQRIIETLFKGPGKIVGYALFLTIDFVT